MRREEGNQHLICWRAALSSEEMGHFSRRTEGRHGEHQWADLRLTQSGNRSGESYAIVHSDITEITQPSNSEKGESRGGAHECCLGERWGGARVPSKLETRQWKPR